MIIEQDNSNWDLIIEPKKGLFDLKLLQVWRYRDLLLLLVRRDFVAYYKQTILGPIWFFIQPLATTVTYVFIFSTLAGISTDGVQPVLFYLAGITAWGYFSECLIKTANVFQANASLFGKVYFPRLIMPLSVVISSLVKLAVQFLLLIMVLLYYAVTTGELSITWYVVLFPVFVLLMAIQGLGFGMIVSAMTTKYRDLALLLTFGVQILMYATPVIYPLSSLTGKIRLLVSLNPMTAIVEGIRLSFLGHGTLTLFSLLYTICISTIVLILGTVVYNKVEKNFIDVI
ncbi:MAG: ABC transporter permease [Phormidesmis sp. FL-bin-119]|nr:ABC transporter permease [Pedobacter sp.]